VTHPFHPLLGCHFELVVVRRNWGEDRVYYHDEEGRLRLIPRGWTSLASQDPFVVAAAGRALFRIEDLLRLAELVRRQGEDAG